MTTLMFALTLTFEVGTVCVSSASTGSVRGVSGNRHPYRDLRASARARFRACVCLFVSMG